MPANAVVRARIDERLKDEATTVLSELGLTISDLVRITLSFAGHIARVAAPAYQRAISGSA